MPEILSTDEYGVNYVAASFETAQEAYDSLQEALDNAETLPEARRLAAALEQAAEMLWAQTETETAIDRSGLKNLYETTDKYWGHSRY